MMKFVKQVRVPAPRSDVFDYCVSRAGFCQQFPFAIKWNAGPEAWQRGDVLDFHYRVSGIWLGHRAEVVDFDRNERFVDQMTRGLYRHFVHTHRFCSEGGGTLVRDEIEFSFGFGSLLDRLVGLPTLESTFKKRHAALRDHFSTGGRA